MPLYMIYLHHLDSLTSCTSHKDKIHGLHFYLTNINPFMNNISLRNQNDLPYKQSFILRCLHKPTINKKSQDQKKAPPIPLNVKPLVWILANQPIPHEDSSMLHF